MSLTCRLLLILTLLCSAACADERAYHFQKQVPAPAGGRLTINMDLGAATVVGTDAHEVVVRAEVLSAAGGPGLSVQVEPTDTGVEVRERYTRTLGGFWFGDAPRARFTIEVPRDYPVEIHTSGGGLELGGLHAGVHGTTSGGGITVRDVQGTVDVHTMGGGIAVEHLQGPARLITMGGGIRATDVKGDLEARTLGGSIRLAQVDGTISAETAGGGVSADELGDHDVTLLTNGGGIHLRMPATVHAALDASTVGGGVRSDIPLSSTESSGHSFLRGSFNGAGHTIRLHTIGGGIRIQPLA